MKTARRKKSVERRVRTSGGEPLKTTRYGTIDTKVASPLNDENSNRTPASYDNLGGVFDKHELPPMTEVRSASNNRQGLPSGHASDQWELENLLSQNHAPQKSSAVTTLAQIVENRDALDADAELQDQDQATTAPEISEKDEEEGPSDQSDEDEEDELTGWKKQEYIDKNVDLVMAVSWFGTWTARLILPHVGLVLLTCAYTVIGASVFYGIERPHERQTKRDTLRNLYLNRGRFLSDMWNRSRTDMTEQDWKELGEKYLNNLTDDLFFSFEKIFLSANEVKNNGTAEIWTFSTAIFFAVTVVTTIGYGNPVPVTTAGQLTCVFFALFGIPLTLVTIADIGKFFSEHLIWMYYSYLKLEDRIKLRFQKKKECKHVCDRCGTVNMNIQEKKIPASLVLAILIGYTALGAVMMWKLEEWDFSESFYYSFITLTTVGFGDLMPDKNDISIFFVLLYILIGLAITTMCIDLVGVQYIRKIHYFGRKIQDARSALAVVGGKVVYVSELYANLLHRKDRNAEAFIIENIYLTKHIIPYTPRDIKKIRYIDATTESVTSSSSSIDACHSCKYCHSRLAAEASNASRLSKR